MKFRLHSSWPVQKSVKNVQFQPNIFCCFVRKKIARSESTRMTFGNCVLEISPPPPPHLFHCP